MVLLAVLLTSAGSAFLAGGIARPTVVVPQQQQQRTAVHPTMQVEAPPAETKSEFEKASYDTSIDDVPKCPLTRWNADGIDLDALPGRDRVLPITIRYDASSGMSESEYFLTQRDTLLQQLTAGGAIWFRGFELMKSKEGFTHFYQQLGLDPCQDPLASVGARAIVSKKGAMYEAVNKPSRAKFFVGMHNESTNKRTNRLGAFVCFKRAETGGEFLLLDGQKMLRDMDPAVLARLYTRGVQFSNAELPFFDFLRSAGPLKEVLKPVFKSVADVAVGAKIDMQLDLRWDENEKDGLRLLAFSERQSPVNRHPITGDAAWFCNVHSHSRYLRDRRDGDLPETSGASKLNRTNMYYGDGTEIPAADLDHIDEITMKNLVKVPMEAGDVVLVDNYQVMHGRDIFTGERLHAVTWFQ